MRQKPSSSSQETSYISYDLMLHLNFCVEKSIHLCSLCRFNKVNIQIRVMLLRSCLSKEMLAELYHLFNGLIILRYCFERDTSGDD